MRLFLLDMSRMNKSFGMVVLDAVGEPILPRPAYPEESV